MPVLLDYSIATTKTDWKISRCACKEHSPPIRDEVKTGRVAARRLPVKAIKSGRRIDYLG